MYSHCTYVCGFEFRLSHLRASLSFPFSRFESSLCTLWRPVLSFQNLRLDTLYVYMCTTCIFFLHLFSHIYIHRYIHSTKPPICHFQTRTRDCLIEQNTTKILSICFSETSFRIPLTRAFYSYQNINDPSLLFVRVFRDL